MSKSQHLSSKQVSRQPSHPLSPTHQTPQLLFLLTQTHTPSTSPSSYFASSGSALVFQLSPLLHSALTAIGVNFKVATEAENSPFKSLLPCCTSIRYLQHLPHFLPGLVTHPNTHIHASSSQPQSLFPEVFVTRLTYFLRSPRYSLISGSNPNISRLPNIRRNSSLGFC